MRVLVDRFDPVRRFYDDEYYAAHAATGTLPWHCRRIAARLGDMSRKHVLDVACGTGEWLEYFHRAGAEIAGIDLSRKAIDACLKKFPKGDFHCGPAESLPFDGNRFDLVICMGSLEHFLDKRKALEEMRRVAKYDAQFLILVPNAGFLTRRLGLYGGTQQVRVREDVLELDSWQKLFEASGLRVIDRWRDLHPLSPAWICRGKAVGWPVRAAQAVALTLWPLGWQYQVYHHCRTIHD